jgi:anti-anti-sigma factor
VNGDQKPIVRPGATIEWEVRADIGILRVIGYLEEKSGEKLQEMVQRLATQGRCDFVLDFSACPVVNSLGIVKLGDVVLEVTEQLVGQVYLVGLNELQTRVFRLSGLLQEARQAGTVEQALELIALPR